MKWSVFLLAVLLLAFVPGCEKNEKPLPSGVPSIEDFDAQSAVDDGWMVTVSESVSSSGYELDGGEYWYDFIEASQNGKASEFYVAHKIGNELFLTRLVYNGDTYTIYKDINDESTMREWKYLRELKTTDGMPRREVSVWVLTDSLELTGRDVLHSFYSSNLESVTKIPFYWLGFTTYLYQRDKSTAAQ